MDGREATHTHIKPEPRTEMKLLYYCIWHDYQSMCFTVSSANAPRLSDICVYFDVFGQTNGMDGALGRQWRNREMVTNLL